MTIGIIAFSIDFFILLFVEVDAAKTSRERMEVETTALTNKQYVLDPGFY